MRHAVSKGESNLLQVCPKKFCTNSQMNSSTVYGIYKINFSFLPVTLVYNHFEQQKKCIYLNITNGSCSHLSSLYSSFSYSSSSCHLLEDYIILIFIAYHCARMGLHPTRVRIFNSWCLMEDLIWC